MKIVRRLNSCVILILGVLSFSCKKDDSQINEQSIDRSSETIELNTQDDARDLLKDFYIQSEKVGPFQIGHERPTSLPEVLQMRKFKANDINNEGKYENHVHYVVFNKLEDLLELMMYVDQGHQEYKRVEEMWVISNYFETKEGITVGDTKEELLWNYEDVSAWYDSVHDRFLLETEELLGVQFIISRQYIYNFEQSYQDYQELDLNQIDDEAEIIMIRVY